MPTKASDHDSDSEVDVTTRSDRDIHSDDSGGMEDEGEEEADEATESEEEERPSSPTVVWTGYGKKIPILVFRADALINKRPESRRIGEKYHMTYKLVKTECKLIRSVLGSHGFRETHPNSNEFNLMWTGSHLKPYTLRGLHEFQKVNHFPRSYEITRKDRLFKNIQRMQQTKGFRHFDIVPISYIIPGEFQEFCSAYLKDKGPYIVKPIASSRGRGIFLVNHPEQVPLDDTMIVSRYIPNPLLIDGFKFDVRLYVAVTSYDPLLIYLYEEGLTRFATVKYDKSSRSIRNQCMHLTNYSVNKKNTDYVKNDDPDVEDYGNKWSLGALLRYLRSQGKDTTSLMLRIEDVLIKTLMSAELPVATACKMFMPHRGNCFELYGFDILIDDSLRPWVLEVNLSPSLACDAPLDLKIKSNMIADLFSITGFMCQDPSSRKPHHGRRPNEVISKPGYGRSQSAFGRPNSAFSQRWEKTDRTWKSKRQRPISACSAASGKGSSKPGATGLTGEEIRIVRRTKEEYLRRGGWIRIFPSPHSWELYGSFFQSTSTHNFMLYQQLFPERAKSLPVKPTSAGYASMSRAKSVHLHSSQYPQLDVTAQLESLMASAIQRSLQYERKLSAIGMRTRPKASAKPKFSQGSPSLNGSLKGSLVQGVIREVTSSTKAAIANKEVRRNPAVPQSDPEPTCKPVPVISKSVKRTQERDSSPPRHVSQSVRSKSAASTPGQTSPKFNVVELLNKGRTMSKVQARFAFATYLNRVQQRLMAETGSNDIEDVDAANEQMDLVLRFLKRAAGNLQQPFKVVVPSRKLQINDRRRILAKQLGDFVHIYNKETEQLRQRNDIERKHLRRPSSYGRNDGLDEDRFSHFVNTASENDLEDVLTTYTKLNKSASIFLGSNAKSNYEQRPPTQGGSGNLYQSHSDTSLARRKESGVTSDTNYSYRRNNDDTSRALYGSESGRNNQSESMPATNSNSLSSYTSAVSIYSQKMTQSASLRQRPYSANNPKNPGTSSKARPLSAHVPQSSSSMRPLVTSQREQPDGAGRADEGDWDETNPEQYDEEAINSAIHRLAVRQQQRHWSASKGRNILSKDGSNKGDKRSRTASWSGVAPIENFPTQMQKTYGRGSYEHLESVHLDDSKNNNHNPQHRTARASSTLGHHRVTSSANETFNSFVSDSVPYPNLEEAFDHVLGHQDMTSVGGSKRQQQVALRQKAMMEQSRALLEQSKAKHQAMVAQAHAAQRSRQSDPSDEPDTDYNPHVHVPKPPPNPPVSKKPASTHRMARMVVDDDGLYGDHFYSSIKYDSNAETCMPVYTNGYNTGP